MRQSLSRDGQGGALLREVAKLDGVRRQHGCNLGKELLGRQLDRVRRQHGCNLGKELLGRPTIECRYGSCSGHVHPRKGGNAGEEDPQREPWRRAPSLARSHAMVQGRIHFRPESITSNDTFIQTRFHPMTLSSKTLSSKFDTFIQQQFQPITVSSKKKITCGTINKVHVCVKASPAEGWRRLHTNTAYAPPFGFQQAFM